MIRLLLVDDDPFVAGAIEQTLAGQGYDIETQEDGAAAWRMLQEDSGFDAVLLDWNLPGLDGLEILKRIKADRTLKRIPVIMVTSHTDIASVRKGLDAGAYYYLTKPLQAELLRTVVRAGLEQGRVEKDLFGNLDLLSDCFEQLSEGLFHFRTPQEARNLSRCLSRLCPDPERSLLGLWELLLNAVEHGNLGISYAEKSRLLEENAWEQAVEDRLADPVFGNRNASVSVARNGSAVTFVICDQGDGFDWANYLDFDPERAFDAHGRGIAMARQASFDEVEFLGNGNTVRATLNAGKVDVSD